MAGGYKLFSTGEVLTAANVNNYLMNQTVMVFASAAARTTALSGVLAEGMISYRSDAKVLEIYNGTSWITESAFVSPLTTKGDVHTYSTTDARLGVGTTNQTLIVDSTQTTGLKWAASPQSTLSAKGSLVSASAANTLAELTVGTNNQVLTADSAQALGLKWASPAGGGKVLQVVQGTTATSVTISTSTITDTGLTATITPTLSTSKVLVLVTQGALLSTVPYAQTSAAYYLYNGSSAIVSGTNGVYSFTNQPSSGNYQQRSYWPLHYLDSPATTSATTYKTRASAGSNSSTVNFNDFTSTIILLEIGA